MNEKATIKASHGNKVCLLLDDCKHFLAWLFLRNDFSDDMCVLDISLKPLSVALSDRPVIVISLDAEVNVRSFARCMRT